MPYHTYHNYGYGLCIDNITIDSIDRIRLLLNKAPILKKDVDAWFEECGISEPTLKDYEDLDQDSGMGFAYLLKEVILEREKIELLACRDFDDRTYLMYEICYPWYMTRKEKRLTPEKLDKIFNRYLRILTDQPYKLGDVESENGG